MTFEEWWEDVSDAYFDSTGTYPNDVTKSFSLAAWEAAQAQDKGVAGEIKEMRAEYPSLRDEFAMAALQGLTANNDLFGPDENYARWAYQHADAMLKEREK